MELEEFNKIKRTLMDRIFDGRKTMCRAGMQLAASRLAYKYSFENNEKYLEVLPHLTSNNGMPLIERLPDQEDLKYHIKDKINGLESDLEHKSLYKCQREDIIDKINELYELEDDLESYIDSAAYNE